MKLMISGNFCLYPRKGEVAVDLDCNRRTVEALGLITGDYGWIVVGEVQGYGPHRVRSYHWAEAERIAARIAEWEARHPEINEYRTAPRYDRDARNAEMWPIRHLHSNWMFILKEGHDFCGQTKERMRAKWWAAWQQACPGPSAKLP